MAHNTIFLQGNKLLKTLTIYIALTRISKKKMQFLFALNNFCTSTIYLSASQASTSQHLANFVAFQAPTSLPNFWEN